MVRYFEAMVEWGTKGNPRNAESSLASYLEKEILVDMTEKEKC